jgi:hypothetical protein
MNDSDIITPITYSGISYNKLSTKYVIEFSSSGLGHIIFDRSSWPTTINFNTGMTIFAVLQPTQNIKFDVLQPKQNTTKHPTGD